MTDFTENQADKLASIQKSAMTWGAVVAIIVGLLALWILSGQGSAIRFGGAAALAIGAGVLTRNASFKSGAKTAKCAACGAAFSRSRTDRNEVLVSSAPKEERKTQDEGSIEVTNWIEEIYDVTDIYTCSTCGDVTKNTYQTTRRKDVETTVERRKKSVADAESTQVAETSETPVSAPKKKSSSIDGAPKKKAVEGDAIPKKKSTSRGRKSSS